MYDEIAARFFSDPESFGEAVTLLSKYDLVAPGDWTETVEPFLSNLTEWQDRLLENAIEYRKARETKTETQQDNFNREWQINIEKTLKQLSERHRPLDSRPLSALIEVYLTQRRYSWKKKHTETNTRDNKPKITLLVEVLGDINSADLSPAHLVKFRDALHRLPRNRKKGVNAGKSIEELLSLDFEESERWKLSTVKNYAQKVSAFLKWLARNNYSVAGLEQPLTGMKAPEKAAHEERPIFTPDELNRLFESKQYLQGTHKMPAHYWVPLLALFTGARQTELCQLYVEDIRQEGPKKIWVMDINEKHEDQKLKKPLRIPDQACH